MSIYEYDAETIEHLFVDMLAVNPLDIRCYLSKNDDGFYEYHTSRDPDTIARIKAGDSLAIVHELDIPGIATDVRSIQMHFEDRCSPKRFVYPSTLGNLIRHLFRLLPSQDYGEAPTHMVSRCSLFSNNIVFNREKFNAFRAREADGWPIPIRVDAPDAVELIWPDGAKLFIHSGECPEFQRTVYPKWSRYWRHITNRY